MFTISVETRFWASHQMVLSDGSKEPLHYHNWLVTADVGCQKLNHMAVVMDFHELKKMVEEIRNMEKTLGSFEKKPTKSEKEIMKIVRKSIVAKQDIEKGSVIKKEMIMIKRPGTGIKPSDLNMIIGKKAKKQIFEDEVIQMKMVE